MQKHNSTLARETLAALDIEEVVGAYLSSNHYMSLRRLARQCGVSKSALCAHINKRCPSHLVAAYKRKAERQMTVYLEKISALTDKTAADLLGYTADDLSY